MWFRFFVSGSVDGLGGDRIYPCTTDSAHGPNVMLHTLRADLPCPTQIPTTQPQNPRFPILGDGAAPHR